MIVKKIINWLVFGGAIQMAIINQVNAKSISVTVNNIDIGRPGVVLVMLFGREGFPKDHGQALVIKSQTAEKNELVFNFDVALSEFAIKVLHDENEDGKTTKDWTGIIPAEGLGFSNGAKLGIFGPPSFKRSALQIEEVNSDLSISVIYP